MKTRNFHCASDWQPWIGNAWLHNLLCLNLKSPLRGRILIVQAENLSCACITWLASAILFMCQNHWLMCCYQLICYIQWYWCMCAVQPVKLDPALLLCLYLHGNSICCCSSLHHPNLLLMCLSFDVGIYWKCLCMLLFKKSSPEGSLWLIKLFESSLQNIHSQMLLWCHLL